MRISRLLETSGVEWGLQEAQKGSRDGHPH
nr:MAG TPA: hypothetical protein [Caudoviricetes sp.]